MGLVDALNQARLDREAACGASARTSSSGEGIWAAPRSASARICITAWSTAGPGSFDTDDPRGAILEEHQLLGEVLRLLLRHPTIPRELLHGSLVDQIPPYPRVIASSDGLGNPADFWSTLNQPVRPSLNYVITLAMLLDEGPEALGWSVAEVDSEVEQAAEQG